MNIRIWALPFILFLNLVSSALAQSPAPKPVIETGDVTTSDAAMAERLEDIFKQIEALHGITVTVDGGVVSLGGNVPNETSASDAMMIAERVEGTVTVQDGITRTLEVEDNLRPVVEQFSSLLTRLARAWPLYLLAAFSFFVVSGLAYLLAAVGPLWHMLAPNPFTSKCSIE